MAFAIEQFSDLSGEVHMYWGAATELRAALKADPDDPLIGCMLAEVAWLEVNAISHKMRLRYGALLVEALGHRSAVA